MAGRQIGKYIPDWVNIAKRVPQEARAEFMRFRAKHETIKSGLDAVPSKPQPINWDFYASRISKPGMVEAFRKAYEAVTVPYPKDSTTPSIDKRQKELDEHAVRVIRESKVRIAELENELKKIKAMKSFEDMSVDDYLELHPELKTQAEEEIKKNVWM